MPFGKGTYKGKSMKLGGGGRFQKGSDALQDKGMSEDRADAIMASKGRAKYGKAKFQAMALRGRKG